MGAQRRSRSDPRIRRSGDSALARPTSGLRGRGARLAHQLDRKLGLGTECHWALVDEDNGALLGRVALKGIDLYDGKAGVAYWMVPDARGRGMCTAAVAAVSNWAFRDAGFHRLSLEHSTANRASCRVAEKARFTIEGVRRGAARHADGWHDMCLHGRLVTDS